MRQPADAGRDVSDDGCDVRLRGDAGQLPLEERAQIVGADEVDGESVRADRPAANGLGDLVERIDGAGRFPRPGLGPSDREVEYLALGHTELVADELGITRTIREPAHPVVRCGRGAARSKPAELSVVGDAVADNDDTVRSGAGGGRERGGRREGHPKQDPLHSVFGSNKQASSEGLYPELR